MPELSTKVLSRPVLVLNKGFYAFAVTTVEDALVAIFSGRAEAVNHTDHASYESYTWQTWSELRPADGDELVHTPSQALIAPQVIRMIEYTVVPRRGVTCSRINVCKRDNWKCQYCGKKLDTKTMTWDHVIPRTQGGTSCWENLVASCGDCNQRKGGRTPRQAGMMLIKKPVKPAYSPEFAQHARKFTSWQKFLDHQYWEIELKG